MTADTTGAGSSQSLLKLATQDVAKPITGAAIFQVLTVRPGAEARAAVRAMCGDLAGLLRAVGFRDIEANLTCVLGLGAALWDRLGQPARPAGLHPFQEIHYDGRHAVATPGDLLFHIRAARMDLCFELATQITTRLGDAVHRGRRGARLPLLRRPGPASASWTGRRTRSAQAAVEATVIGAEDPEFAGGSYVIVQKYLHDLAAWNALPVEEQERIIGRTKLADIELDDTVKPTLRAQRADHDHRGRRGNRDRPRQHAVRQRRRRASSAPTSSVTPARPSTIEQMLRNMFVGRPPGNYDRLLDVSRAVTGTLFFVPSVPLLESLAEDPDGSGDSGRS